MCVFTDIILIMKNRHHHPRRSVLRDGKQHKKLRLNFTLRGEKGKPVRIALCCAAGLVLLVLLAALLKPRTQLMNTPEIQRIRERGVLAVGVRDDMPLFASVQKKVAEEEVERFSPVEEALEAVNPDELTPREALEKLYEIKALL